MGARVEVDSDGENLVRTSAAASRPSGGRNHAPAVKALVQAQGLPNLLHELVHAVQAGTLDDDHGIDYGAIPFPLDTEAGRAVLWNELACCVISCAYLWAHGRAARLEQPNAVVEANVQDWFREQVEIQPVFYGMENDPTAFYSRVDTLLRDHHVESMAVLERAYQATEHALLRGGASPELCVPTERPTMQTLWPHARQCLAAAE